MPEALLQLPSFNLKVKPLQMQGLKTLWTNSSGKQVNMEMLHIAKLKSCKKELTILGW